MGGGGWLSTVRLMKRVASCLVIGVLLVACGDDDSSGGGDQEAFCETLASSAEGPDLESEEGIAAFRELIEVAPGEIRGDLDVLADAVERLEGLDENDPDAFEEFFTIALDPRVVSATENLEDYAVERCGLDPDNFDDDGEESGSDPLEVDADLGVVSVDGIQAHLDAEYTGAEWVDEINGWSVFMGRRVEVQGDDLADDALVACEAILGYATGIDPEATVKVSDFSGNDFATGDASSGCALSG